MNWVLTNAQIELIAADVSVVDYNYKSNSKGNGKKSKGEFDDTKADAGQIKKAAEKWTQKHGTGQNAGWVNVKDILGKGMKTGVGLNVK